MTDGQQFLLIFTLVYVSECLYWAPKHAVGFATWWLRHWRVMRPNPFAGNRSGGLLMSAPLPPLGEFLVAEPWPVAITEEGLSSPPADFPNPGGYVPRPHWIIRWDKLESIEAQGRRLLLNDHSAKTASAAEALHLARLVQRLKKADSEKRGELIRRFLRLSLSGSRVRRRLQILRGRIGTLRVQGNILFFLTFGLIPFGYWLLGDSLRFFFLLAVVWVCMIQIAWDYYRVHRKSFPELAEERRLHVILCVCLPQYGMRAHDLISRGFLAGFHPAAIEAVLLKERDYSIEVNAFWRDVCHPLPPPELESSTPPILENGRRFHDKCLLPAMRELLIEFPPEDLNNAGNRHCPRCRAPYEESAEHCLDCLGIELVSAGDGSA